MAIQCQYEGVLGVVCVALLAYTIYVIAEDPLVLF